MSKNFRRDSQNFPSDVKKNIAICFTNGII